VDIKSIRERVQTGSYLIKSHAITHAIKEGFDRENRVECVLQGNIIEEYPDSSRVLVCGRTVLSGDLNIYLHVVCEYSDPNYIEFVTAYIPG